MEKRIKNFFQLLESKLSRPVNLMTRNLLLKALRKTCSILVPLIITGSFFLTIPKLLVNVIFIGDLMKPWFENFNTILLLPYEASIGILALLFSQVLGYEYTKIIKKEKNIELNELNGAILSCFALFISLPKLSINNAEIIKVNELQLGIFEGIEITKVILPLSAIGIIHSIIITAIVIKIYSECIRRNVIYISNESVPEGIRNMINKIWPFLFVALAIVSLKIVLLLFNTDMFQISIVLLNTTKIVTDNIIGMSMFIFCLHVLWLLGIHGPNIIGAFIGPIMFANLGLNYLNQNVAMTGEYLTAFSYIGGSGAILALVILIIFFAKSSELKELGEVSLNGSLFNISESLVFGLPIMFNGYIAAPFLIAPIVNNWVAYYAIKNNLLDPVVGLNPWISPIGIGGILATGDWRAIIISLINLCLSILIYLPFFYKYDQKLLKNQQ